MKATLLALAIALLMVGCGEEVYLNKLLDRNGTMYLPNEETPFTGRAKSFHRNGQKMGEVNFKDGKPHGLMTYWYENGQKEREANCKDGKEVSVEVWKPNGEKCPVTNWKDDNGVVVWYNEDGTERFRVTDKDGEIVRD